MALSYHLVGYRTIEPPVDDGRDGGRAPEHVSAARERQRGRVPAVRPAPDARAVVIHPRQVLLEVSEKIVRGE